MLELVIKIIAVFVIILLSLILGSSNNILILSLSIFLSFIAGSIFNSTYGFFDNKGQSIKTWFLSTFVYRNKEIRLSFSYLYKLEVNGKYLLIRGNRIKNKYQPIGGVYKFYQEARDFLNSLNFIPDVKVGNIDDTDDLRIKLNGKYLLSFYEWFFSMNNREYDPTREFYEEMIKTGLLPEEKFRNMHYRKIRKHDIGITNSTYHKMHEVIYADIFEVTLTKEQKQLILEAVKKHPDKLILATDEEMIQERTSDSVDTNIGNNAKWLLGKD